MAGQAGPALTPRTAHIHMGTTAANPSSLDLRLLGPLTVTVDGQPVPVGGPRQMAVLARLMLTPDQVVTMDQLVDSVWDGDEPARPQVAVRSYISNLRRAIEPNRRRRSADTCLVGSPSGYRLAVDPGAIDWVRFERLVEEGRSRLAGGDASGAVALLDRARSLWAGVPCSGLPQSVFVLAHRSRLTDLRDTATELLFEARLARGDHGSVAAEVEAAIAESPLRERLTELGMLALYRAGRQSEALAIGQKLRARLLDELGVDPSPSIDAIELKILNHDASLDGRPVGPGSPEGHPAAPPGGAGRGPAGDPAPPWAASGGGSAGRRSAESDRDAGIAPDGDAAHPTLACHRRRPTGRPLTSRGPPRCCAPGTARGSTPGSPSASTSWARWVGARSWRRCCRSARCWPPGGR